MAMSGTSLEFNTFSHLVVKIRKLALLGAFREVSPHYIEELIILLRRGHYHAVEGFCDNPTYTLHKIFVAFNNELAKELAFDILIGTYEETRPKELPYFNLYLQKKLPTKRMPQPCSYCLENVLYGQGIVQGRGSKGFVLLHHDCAQEVELTKYLYSVPVKN